MTTKAPIIGGSINNLLSTNDLSTFTLVLLVRPVKYNKKENEKKKDTPKPAPVPVTILEPKIRVAQAPIPKVDTSEMNTSFEELNIQMKRLPKTQLALIRYLLRGMLAVFKKGVKEGAEKTGLKGPQDALKLASNSLKQALIDAEQGFQDGNMQDKPGTMANLSKSFRAFARNLNKVQKEGGLELDERKALEQNHKAEIAHLRSEAKKAKEDMLRKGVSEMEMEQLRNDYTEALQSGMRSQSRVKELEEQLAEAKEQALVLKSALDGPMKMALEDEILKRRKAELQVEVLELVYEVGIKKLWSSEVKKILTTLEQKKIESDPIKQLRRLIDDPPLD